MVDCAGSHGWKYLGMVHRIVISSANRSKGMGAQVNRLTRRVLLIGAALALFVVPVAAIAAAGFVDVDDDSVFVADIEWLKDSGVTLGCNPPANDRFCPKDNVTREQMAAFMHRLAANQVVDAATVGGKTAAELTGVPGPAGPPGAAGDQITFYKVEASTVAWNNSVVGSNPACALGDQAVSGSYTTPSPSPANHIVMTTNSVSADGRSWVFQGVGIGVGSYDSLVLCANVTSP